MASMVITGPSSQSLTGTKAIESWKTQNRTKPNNCTAPLQKKLHCKVLTFYVLSIPEIQNYPFCPTAMHAYVISSQKKLKIHDPLVLLMLSVVGESTSYVQISGEGAKQMVQEHCQGTQNTKSTQRNHPSKCRGVKTQPDRTKTRRRRTLRKLLAYRKTSRTSPYLRDAQHAGLEEEEANKDGQRRLVTDSHSRFETLEGTRNMPSPSLRSRKHTLVLLLIGLNLRPQQDVLILDLQKDTEKKYYDCLVTAKII
ncbi:hypothetical protein Anapl_11120 [Anas platyrhynchos]|uniref:Uncharacterized protein n=1 Tax=Anas platyrhynchos TaxID=8839 RepID=R0K5K7_ANAPL|nr:hypothetical protein Anapl_11120 [Anas platyrhynchos]